MNYIFFHLGGGGEFEKNWCLDAAGKLKEQWTFNFELILVKCKQCIQIRKHFRVGTTNVIIRQALAGRPSFLWGGGGGKPNMPYT